MLILILAFSHEALTQIIKVDKDWVESDSTKAWQSILDISVDNVRNTKTIFQSASDLQVSYAWKKNIILSSSSLRLLFEDNEPLENAGFQHFRYIEEIDSLYSLEGFTQIQFDQLLKIKMRWITGIGIRFTLLGNRMAKLYLRPGYMYEYEQEKSTGIVNSHHRMSNYATLRLNGGERTKFYFTIFYQPRFDKFNDFRISPAWTVELKVLKKLIVSISGDFRYDTRPVEGVNRFTYILSQGFGWRF